jgi:hypothetical protein
VGAAHDEPFAVLDDFAHDEQRHAAHGDADRHNLALAHLVDDRDGDFFDAPFVRRNVCHWTTHFKEIEAFSATVKSQPA